MTTLSDFTADALDGTPVDLAAYAGKVVLVVNTASKCGFTPQFDGLEKLHSRYGAQGLAVLGFPCNQFGNQEPGSAEQIGEYCQKNYGVTFEMFARIDVNGSQAHPLYAWLRSQKPGFGGNAIKWNFTKFLIGKDGAVLRRYSPTTEPADIASDIEAALAA